MISDASIGCWRTAAQTTADSPCVSAVTVPDPVLVTGAGVQDRDGARPLLWALHACFPGIRLVWTDSGYAGQLVAWAKQQLILTLQIVTKLAGQTTFVVLHRRWAVERTFSWINRCRRTVRDYERRPEHHAAMIQWAMIIIMTRRLARHHHT